MQIASIKDQKIQLAQELRTVKGRELHGKVLLEGKEQIEWGLLTGLAFEFVIFSDKLTDDPFVKEIGHLKIPAYSASEGVLKKISETSYCIPYIAVAKLSSASDAVHNFLVVLDDVKDFGNIGTIVRTAAAFGIDDFALIPKETDFFTRKAIDASRGSVFSAHCRRFSNPKEVIGHLKQLGFQIVVTTPHQSMVQSFASLDGKPVALVFGNETSGVSDEFLKAADLLIQIPMSFQMESLNVGVAAGISLYEMKLKWVLAMLDAKIQSSLGRHLYCASRWVRLIFDQMLRASTPFNADQAICLMIIKREPSLHLEKLLHDAGVSLDITLEQILQPLLDQGYIRKEADQLFVNEQGSEALAKIWSIHEKAESIVMEGFSDQDKKDLFSLLERLQANCSKIIPYL